MSAASNIIKLFQLFVDGRGYAGEAEEVQPPNLTLLIEQFRGGGMDAPVGIDMGMEELTASFNLTSVAKEVLARFGIVGETGFTLRGSTESLDGTTEAIVEQWRGKITSVEKAAWQGGQKVGYTYNLSLTYYRLEIGGTVIHEIDVLNTVRIINGVDQLAQHRANIGL